MRNRTTESFDNLFAFRVEKRLDTITDVVEDQIVQVVKQRYL